MAREAIAGSRKSMLRRIYTASFFFSTGLALSAYVNSTFLNSFFSETALGIIYALGAAFTLFFLSEAAPAIQRLGNRRMMLSLLTANIAALFSFTFLQTPWLIAAAFVVYMVTNSITILCLDVFVEHYSHDASTGRTRGLYLTISNGAWVLAPLVAATILTATGFSGVYALSIAAASIVFLVVYKKLYPFRDSAYEKVPVRKTLRFISDYRPLFSVTVVNFLLQFFYAIMVIYSPIYLNKHIGLSWPEIGTVFTVMLTAFVIFQYSVGRYVDKRASEKELLSVGLLIAGLACIAISVMTTQNVALWALVFFMTRTGASIIEATAETHFFKETKDADTSIMSVYRNMYPLAYLIAPVAGSLILLFLPFYYIFFILGMVLLAGIYYSMRLENSNALWSRSHTQSE